MYLFIEALNHNYKAQELLLTMHERSCALAGIKPGFLHAKHVLRPAHQASLQLPIRVSLLITTSPLKS